MAFVVAGAVLLGAWLVGRAIDKVRVELLAARVLQESLAEKQGLDMEEYGDELAFQMTGLRSSRQIARDIEQDAESP